MTRAGVLSVPLNEVSPGERVRTAIADGQYEVAKKKLLDYARSTRQRDLSNQAVTL
jgi:hypothetical protein